MSNAVEIRRAAASVAVLAVCGLAAGALLWTAATVQAAWTALRQPGGAAERLVEHTVVLLCSAALSVVLLWLSASVLVCTVEAVRALGGAAHELRGGALRPYLVRALVAGAVGGLVTAGAAAPAGGDSGDGAPGNQDLPRALVGLPLPDRAYGGVRTHLVRAGESLWSITAEHLPAGTCTGVVGRRWPTLHRLNRDRIGGDPDLIHPGTNLRLPAWGPRRPEE